MQIQSISSAPIQLSEYQPKFLHLSEADRAYIQTRFSGRLRLSQQVLGDETWDVVDPGPHVGVLTLPSSRRVECRPKVDAANVFYMMAVAHELPRLEEEIAEFDSFDELLEFVVDRFATLAEERIQAGLFRRYLDHEENLGVVRGRIMIAQDLQQNFALRHRIYCEFSELSWDIPENQVIRQVADQMLRWPFRRELQSRLYQIESTLAEVTASRHDAAVIDDFIYNRLNYEYRPVHQLCRLLLDAASFHEDAGDFEFQTFLVNMNDLFEKYVAKSLEEGLPLRFSTRAQADSHLDRHRLVNITPDVVVSQAGAPICILDTKYKRLDAGEFKNHDLYQVLSYCTALRTTQGMLVYPKHLVGLEQDSEVRNSDITIRQVTLDLGGSVDDLRLATTSLVAAVSEWSDRSTRPDEPHSLGTKKWPQH